VRRQSLGGVRFCYTGSFGVVIPTQYFVFMDFSTRVCTHALGSLPIGISISLISRELSF
jgi:hypothetical protein